MEVEAMAAAVVAVAMAEVATAAVAVVADAEMAANGADVKRGHQGEFSKSAWGQPRRFF